jgi:phage shock protein PspC (stress-responsive transcriptional regulator)
MRRSHLLCGVAIGAMVAAFALPMQSVGCGQNAHYAATRSFAEGHPWIDRYASETCDVVRRDGHDYAAKGPALDFWAAPWYMLLHAVGAVPSNRNAHLGYPAAMLGVPLRAVWQIGLWAVVLPSLVLLLLVRRLADELEPGTGAAAAVTLGLGTLVLPFSTLFFAHVPAAMLAFAAFGLLYRSRTPRAAAAAGACAGLAIAFDLPLAVVAVALTAYAAARTPRIRRVAAFAGGAVVGLTPLFAFGIWAFGSPFRLAYSGAAINPGRGGHEQADVRGLFFTLTSPHPRLALELLLSQRGLLVLTPVLAASAGGVVLLWRRRQRAEAMLIGGLSVAELCWNAFRPDYALALGGWVPGPRFLIPLLPFLCFALAPALRRAPATVGALALISAGAMVVATSAEPLLQDDDTRHWLSRIGHGNFAATVVSLTGVGHGWLAILPFYALVVVAAIAAIAATRLPLERRDLAVAAAAVVAWLVVEHGAPELLRIDRAVHQSYGAITAILLVAASAWAVLRLRPEGLPLLAFGTIRVADHTKWALLLTLLVLGALAAGERVRRSPVPA